MDVPIADECSLTRPQHTALKDQWRQGADNFPQDTVVGEDDPEYIAGRLGPNDLDPYEVYETRLNMNGGHASNSGIKLSCVYEENAYVPAANLRWFESPSSKNLFYMTKFPQKNEDFVEVPPENPEDPESLPQRWGQNDYIVNLLDNAGDFLVNVEIDGDTPGLLTLIPRSVRLIIPYYQNTRETKSLVSVQLSLYHFCTVTEVLAEKELMMSRSPPVYQCISKLDSDGSGRDGITSYDYVLEVHYYPMVWYDLLNQFEFEADVYIIAFLMVGCVTVLIGFVFWGMHRLLTRMKHPPPFRFRALFMLVAPAPTIGVLLACVPVWMGYGSLYLWLVESRSEQPLERPQAINFEAHPGDWQDQAILDLVRVEAYRTGRLGTAFIFMGMYLTMMGCKMFVPESADDHADDDTMAEVGGDAEAALDDDEEEMLPPSEFWTPLLWKRTHLLLSSYICCAGCLFVWEFSYSETYSNNVQAVIISLKFVQMVLDQLLASYLRENLLIAPILVTIEITEIMITMGSDSLIDFMVCYFIELLVMILERLYMDPGMKYAAKLMPKWQMMFKRRFAKKRHMTREQRAREEAEWKRINEEIALESEGIEPLLDSYGVYANETAANILTPFINVHLIVFGQYTKIPDLYGIKSKDLFFYFLFAMINIPFSLACDMFLLMAQELIHGWKVYDYVAYQNYRFQVREKRWQMAAWDTLDESIAEPLQAIDMMCFSSQFFFMTTILAWGNLTIMFGISIVLRTSVNGTGYNFFGDVALPIIIVGTWSIGTLINWLCRKAADQVGLWSRRSLQGTVDDEIAAKLAIGEGRQEDLEAERLELQAMNSERFRHRFLDRSRPWVLQHLVELLTPRTLQMPGADGRPVIEYIRDVYTDLMNMGEGRRRPGDRADISSDEGDDDLENMRRNWSKAPLSKPSAALLRYWLERARMRRKLSKLVKGTIDRAVTDTCALCGRTTASGAKMRCDLALDGRADEYALDKLIKGYEETYPDREFDPNLWQSYFRQHASFITRCEQCINLAEQAKKKAPSRRPGKGRGTRAQDISDDDDSDEEQAVFEPMVVTRTSVEGKAMSKWLNAARRRLGGNFPRPNARAEMEAYAQKMRDYKLKKAREEAKAKGLISDDDDFDESGKLQVGHINAASKALCQLWLIRARASLIREKEKRLENIRKELSRVGGLITEEDDWFYGSELRLQGIALKQEGAELDETRRQLKADANAKERELKDELKEFEDEKTRQMEEEIQEIQEKMNKARQLAMEKAEERVQEITRNKTRKAALYEKEEKLAPPEDRAKLVAQHKVELKKLDEAVAAERAKQSEILAAAEMAGEKDLGAKQEKRDQALKDRRDVVSRKCKALNEEVDEKMRDRERDWQNRVNGWVLKAQRKIKAKEADDKAKADKEAERKKRRKLRK